MGLTTQSVGSYAFGTDIAGKLPKGAKVIALAGNPNVGKSTLFNRLTGLKQHTGNWSGKTVTNAVGTYRDKENYFAFVDIPGTYSLMPHSAEEEVARDFLLFGRPDAAVVVCDATCLERNLNLALQVMEICPNTVICVNLLDEAKKKGIKINLKALSERLGVPVVGTSARNGNGLTALISTLKEVFAGEINSPNKIRVTYPGIIESAVDRVANVTQKLISDGSFDPKWVALKLLEGDVELIRSIEGFSKINFYKDSELCSVLSKSKEELAKNGISDNKIKEFSVSAFVLTAEYICDDETVGFTNTDYRERDQKIDRFVTGKFTGSLVMLALLAMVFWITISVANYPSDMLWKGFSFIEERLLAFGAWIGLPDIISDMLFCGVYRVVAWVVSVMLPPMAIFFPIFTLLEDIGYLPRIAFNLDHGFKKCSACGKQALTMCMGFGCNAAGITGARIIDSKRERLIAVITNNFVPCNGRFPTLIAVITMFFVGSMSGVGGSFLAALLLTAVILLGISATFLASKALSCTLLRGEPSSFTLELPPYRRPKIGSVIVRSVFDRTVFVLGRAVAVAAPTGLIIWLMANVTVGGETLLGITSGVLDPFARLMGLDGVILLGFILGFPANEIVIPIIIMAYMQSSSLTDYGSLYELKNLLIANGWTSTTALCTMIFSLMHWPCSTSLMTVKKETGSFYWTFIAFLVPTLCGMTLCILLNLISKLF